MKIWPNRISHLSFFSVMFCLLLPPVLMAGGDGENSGHHLVSNIGISILAATVLAFLAHFAKQPLLLAYIAAGVVIGPKIGFAFVKSEEDIAVIAEIGLILLLFMIGLEIDMKKLKESGKALILSGVFQFIICVLLGLAFFPLLGFTMGGGNYDLLYLTACCALSSTAIVVKLLYGKFELDTLGGRITLGVLVFQDLWAIIILGVQPNLANPEIGTILFSFVKGGALVAMSLLISKYVLPRLFKSIAKIPELLLVVSLGWCFFICGVAGLLGLSIEMGALIAGISISTFPYNLDVIAKVISLRDFFVTLFFVALGMQVPNPFDDLGVVGVAFIVAAFLILSRFLSVFPVLYSLKQGHRISLLPSINLANLSEFSLVIAAIGFSSGHIGNSTLSIIIFVFVITSVCAPYLIKYNQSIQSGISGVLSRIGLKDAGGVIETTAEEESKEIAILGFFRVASSLIRDIQEINSAENAEEANLLEKIVVVDFNPNVHSKLDAIGVKAIYGDISHMDTLHHAGIHDAKIVISTIPDTVLVGTDNLKMIKQLQTICPHAKIIVTAESASRALKMYAEGADYVFLPRTLAALHLIPVIRDLLNDHEHA
ncbi:cation:proton antiporter, partial [bacterium]|nr:cation:proton antiporter [bacterium]